VIVFDLDGTLVNSAPEIVASMEHAWGIVFPDVAFPRADFVIGPPLLDAIGLLTPDAAKQNVLATTFRAHYDRCDFSQTVPFAGIDAMLTALAARGLPVAIATNKRWAPTQIIVTKRFPARFAHIASIDAVHPDDGTVPGSKVGMLAWYAKQNASIVMVGDAPGDIVAGQAVGARTVGVTWGYSPRASLVAAGPDVLVDTVEDLLYALTRDA